MFGGSTLRDWDFDVSDIEGIPELFLLNEFNDLSTFSLFSADPLFDSYNFSVTELESLQCNDQFDS
jgi:hypothetical protein